MQGSFNGGGSPGQNSEDKQDRYELQEYLSYDRGNHFLRAGARYRLTRDSNFSTANYNGQYIFPTLTAYATTLRGQAADGDVEDGDRPLGRVGLEGLDLVEVGSLEPLLL